MATVEEIISRLGTRFTNATEERVLPDGFTREIGGQFRNNQPYISGYFQAMFGLPEKLFAKGAEASKWLHTTIEGFTPHSQTITKVDVMGQGQLGASFPANVMTTREFTTTHREYQNMPMLNIIKQWASVFDPFTGVSPIPGNEFIPQNYKGWCAIIQTKPVRADGKNLEVSDIEECYIYQGVFPTNIPVDTASASDITGNDTIQHSITWSFDGAPLTSAEHGIADKCIELLKSLNPLSGSDLGSTYEEYMKGQEEQVKQWTTIPVASTPSKPSV